MNGCIVRTFCSLLRNIGRQKIWDIFGLTEVWVTKPQPIKVSDKERSIFDGLRQPESAGGIPELAKALWMTRSESKLNRLLDYAHGFDNGALTRRLGFLLELYKVAPSRQLERLRTKLTSL
jgi:predicted transcriptional regulator of viral defense system